MSTTTDVELLRSEEAAELLERETDPVTRALLNNANYWLVRKFVAEKNRPVADLDYRYLLELLRDIFSEHEVIGRLLNGERVGAFFEEDDATTKPEDSLQSVSPARSR
jgi:hypothetical protein